MLDIKGTTVENAAYKGANGEVTVDTVRKTLVVHDGVTLGGHPIIDNEGWITPTLLHDWVSFDAARAPAYRMDRTGYVQIRGMIKLGTVGSSAFVLPAAYYPPHGMNFAVPSNGAYGQVGVTTEVIPTVGNNAYFSLDGISYYAINR